MSLRASVAGSLLLTSLSHISTAEPAFDAAKAFGARPSVEYVSLSPDGMNLGEMDRNVPIRQSKEMADRLAAAGVPHELVTWPALDHQLEDSAVRTEMLRKSDAFLRKAMGMM